MARREGRIAKRELCAGPLPHEHLFPGTKAASARRAGSTLDDQLNLGWEILQTHFTKDQTGLPSKLTDKYWN